MGEEWVSRAAVQIHLHHGDKTEAVPAPVGALAAQPAPQAPSPRHCCTYEVFLSCIFSISTPSRMHGALCHLRVCWALPEAPVAARDR